MFNPLSVNKKMLFLTLLTSAVTLTACGQKEVQSPPGSNSSVATKVTSQSKLAATTVASQAGSAEVQTEEEITETSLGEVVEETASEVEEAIAPVTTALDINALSAGDYSSIAGTWANAKGEYFTVTAEGIIYFGGRAEESGYSKIEHVEPNSNGRVSGSVGSYQGDERHGGAHISIVPAGIANVNDLVSDYDHIEIGHDISSGYSDQQYFRQ